MYYIKLISSARIIQLQTGQFVHKGIKCKIRGDVVK